MDNIKVTFENFENNQTIELVIIEQDDGSHNMSIESKCDVPIDKQDGLHSNLAGIVFTELTKET